MSTPAEAPRTLGLSTASLLVVASMVGTGVFTTSGFLVRDLGSPIAVLVAWVTGGVAAAAGALSYAELVAALPRSGGEYALLGRIYHPAVGFCAGVVSLVVGFAAPVAACALAFAHYAERVVGELPGEAVACGLVVVVAVAHGVRVSLGATLQNAATAVKVALIAAFIAAGVLAGDFSRLGVPGRPLSDALFSGEFAVGLVFVSFAYSGWNASAYVAGEVRDPARTLPRAILLGTGAVAALYVALNAVFLSAANPADLAGVVEVGHVAARALLGEPAAVALSAVIAAGLVSTVGALVMTGPRIAEAMGRDYAPLRLFAVRRVGGGPVAAIALEGLLAIAMVLTASFDALLTYIGFTLSLFAGLTVGGLVVLRAREPRLPRPYRAWAYPLSPLVFLALTAWMVVHTVRARPMVAVVGGATIALGFAAWLAVRRRSAGRGP